MLLTKTVNEAIVEGHGSILDKHADPRRGVSQKTLEKETYIDLNGPSQRDCEPLLVEALYRQFRKADGSKDWKFTTTDSRAKFHVTSKVIDRLSRVESKLSFMN